MEYAKVLAAVTIVFAASPVLAQAAATPYQILKDYYESSTQPADVLDIDLHLTSPQGCVATSEFETAALPYWVAVARFADVVDPGIPSQGHLFPGIPSHVIPECLQWSTDGSIGSMDVNVCSSEVMATVGSDLQVTLPGQLSGIWLRKNGADVTFKLEKSYVRTNSVTGESTTVPYFLYGYCFRQ